METKKERNYSITINRIVLQLMKEFDLSREQAYNRTYIFRNELEKKIKEGRRFFFGRALSFYPKIATIRKLKNNYKKT